MTILAVASALLLAAQDPAPGPIDRFPEAAPSYLVAVDGELVWARAPDAPRAPASLAKLLAALVALESPGLDGWLTVSKRAAAETGSRVGLRAGEQVKVHDAVAAMLVASANDACRAVAEHEAGSAAAFADRMNGRAKVAGARAPPGSSTPAGTTRRDSAPPRATSSGSPARPSGAPRSADWRPSRRCGSRPAPAGSSRPAPPTRSSAGSRGRMA